MSPNKEDLIGFSSLKGTEMTQKWKNTDASSKKSITGIRGQYKMDFLLVVFLEATISKQNYWKHVQLLCFLI